MEIERTAFVDFVEKEKVSGVFWNTCTSLHNQHMYRNYVLRNGQWVTKGKSRVILIFFKKKKRKKGKIQFLDDRGSF